MTPTQQDQDAINHIASVSKHKHAAIIAKWLITGWDVEFKNASGTFVFVSTNHLVWHDKTEYRLVEPKPPKPAYRVYRTGKATNTVDRYADGRYSANYREDLNWVSDWIEYDLKWPTPLVERIAAIDIDAAQWIVDHWDDLLKPEYTGPNNYSRDSDRLLHLFVWNQSDQRGQYWRDIADKLGE